MPVNVGFGMPALNYPGHKNGEVLMLEARAMHWPWYAGIVGQVFPVGHYVFIRLGWVGFRLFRD